MSLNKICRIKCISLKALEIASTLQKKILNKTTHIFLHRTLIHYESSFYIA